MGNIKGFHCLKCGDVPDGTLHEVWYPHKRHGEHYGCGGRVIPIATICDPPEPTVIEASDLAPGMVVVAVDDVDLSSPQSFVCSPDVHLSPITWVTVAANRMTFLIGKSFDVVAVRRVAGEPC